LPPNGKAIQDLIFNLLCFALKMSAEPQPTKFYKARTKKSANLESVEYCNRTRIKLIFHNEAALNSLLQDTKELKKLDPRSYLEEKDNLLIAHLMFFNRQQTQLRHWKRKYPHLGLQKEVMPDDDKYNASVIPGNRLTDIILDVAPENQNLKRLAIMTENEEEEEKECRKRASKKGLTKIDLVQENLVLKRENKTLKEEASELKAYLAHLAKKQNAFCNTMSKFGQRLQSMEKLDKTSLDYFNKKVEAAYLFFKLDPNPNTKAFEFDDIDSMISEELSVEPPGDVEVQKGKDKDKNKDMTLYKKQISQKDQEDDDKRDEGVRETQIVYEKPVSQENQEPTSQKNPLSLSLSPFPLLVYFLTKFKKNFMS
jgi:hypothetical protein